MIDIRGFFLGYRYNDDITSLTFRWLAVAAVIIGAGLMVVLSRCLFC